MTILTVQESAELLKATANNVMADGSVSMYPLHARAILDVVSALEAKTDERNSVYGNFAGAISREVNARNMSADLAEEVSELRVQLAAVTEERDDLIVGAIEREESLKAVTEERDRLRMLVPSWSAAPKQATCLAMDEDGHWTWHFAEPSPCRTMWSNTTWLADAHIGAWQTSLQRRPK